MVVEAELAHLSEEGDPLEDILGGLFPESRQVGEATVTRRLFQLSQRLDVQALPDLPDLGDAKPGDLEHFRKAGGDLVAQVVEQTAPAGREHLAHQLERCRPYPLHSSELAAGERERQVAGERCHRPRRGVIGPHPKGVLALELEERTDLLEHLSRVLLVHGRGENLLPGGNQREVSQ